ncbi:MAG TPA: proton-conducting transporter membrane subunit, partial [Terriglobia bacterium]|nr:proton-conducting transporter membrane subunit [Terriglobia bacterium]
MSPLVLVAVFLILCVAGGLASLVLSEREAPRVLAWVGSLASFAMLGVGVLGLAGKTLQVQLWTLQPLVTLTLSIDPLSGLFLLVSALVFLPASIYSVGYLEHYRGAFNIRSLCACYFGLLAAVALVLSAGDAVSFLISWELMAILGYALVNYQCRGAENPRPGYLMLCMGEAGFVAVVLAFLILAGFSSSLAFSGLRLQAASLNAGVRWAVFLLSFMGFGVKAGLVPLNRWLPQAHPVAPANISALLSGALLNLGIYGIARFNLDLVPVNTAGPGVVMLIVGTVSALTGILYANRRDDMKGMLANSSIENMGVITAGVGAAMVFLASNQKSLAAIALIAALYQMTNHSVYKSLLFFGAGTIDAHAGTRRMDRLGGLIRCMPWVALFFLVGTLSIAALPPASGFVSEWLTLQALLQSSVLSSGAVKVVFALCGAGLALTAGLVVTCFAKVYSMTFLGMPRSPEAERSGGIQNSVRLAMGIGALLCLLLGVLPTYVVPVLGRAVTPLTGAEATSELIPPFFATTSQRPLLPRPFVEDFHNLGAQVGRSVLPGAGLVILHRGGSRNPVVFAMSTSYMLPVIVLLTAGAFWAVRKAISQRTQATRRRVWAGGLSRLLPELTYTATGFSNPVRVTFNAIFHPRESE